MEDIGCSRRTLIEQLGKNGRQKCYDFHNLTINYIEEFIFDLSVRVKMFFPLPFLFEMHGSGKNSALYSTVHTLYLTLLGLTLFVSALLLNVYKL